MSAGWDLEHVVTFEETNLVGNVYFVNHVRWQGHCRELFLRQRAPGVLAQLAEGLALVTTSCSCQYFAELKALPQPRTQERPNCQRAAGARPGLGAVESTVRDDGEAMIGTVASGTGGTNGFHCLRPRGQTRFYPFLHEATSLVHQHRAMAS